MSNSTADLCHPGSLSSSLISPPILLQAKITSSDRKASSPRPLLMGRDAGTPSSHSTPHYTTHKPPPPTQHVPLAALYP